MRRGILAVLLLAGLVAGCLLASCYMPKTPTPHVGQTAAPDETSQAQGTYPEGVRPGLPLVPPSPTLLPSFPTPGTPGAIASPAPPTLTPATPGVYGTVAPGGQP